MHSEIASFLFDFYKKMYILILLICKRKRKNNNSTVAFFNDITLGHYYPADSMVHRLDPRTKLISIMILMVCLLATQRAAAFVLFVILCIVAIHLSRVPIALVLKNLKPFIWLFLLTIFIHLFFTSGKTLYQLPVLGLSITDKGLSLGTLYSVRLALLIVFAALLTLTTSPMEMTDALEKLFRPFKRLKIPTHELVMMMTLSLRFIPTLMAEAERLRKAQISRGASFEGNITRRIKSLIPLILPLFVSAFHRADDLAMAMDSRCYAGGEGRTSFKLLRFHAPDYFVLAAFSSLFLIVIVL